MTHDEMIAVIQRHKNGGKIEYRLKADVTWKDAGSPWWDFDRFDYRAKPEPMVVYVEFHSNGKPMHTRLIPFVPAFDRAVIKFVQATE
jgi:hypothetical protein